MKIVLLGAPGAGKGTVATRLRDEMSVPHISTGEIFREAINNKTELGNKVSEILARGELVPDSLTIALVKERTQNSDCDKGYILDGFPRTMVQAEEWEKIDSVDKVISLDVSVDEVKRRLMGRRVCPKCKATYHVEFQPPKINNTCNLCSTSLEIRPDDREDAIEKRLEVYSSQTSVLLDFYSKINKLITIPADRKPEEVYQSVVSIISK